MIESTVTGNLAPTRASAGMLQVRCCLGAKQTLAQRVANNDVGQFCSALISWADLAVDLESA